jgi:hypothetical protein
MNSVKNNSDAKMVLVGKLNTTHTCDVDSKEIIVCDHKDHVVSIAEYMTTEMKKNPFTKEGKEITEANGFDIQVYLKKWHEEQPLLVRMIGPPDPINLKVSMQSRAYAIWYDRVQYLHPWDHKPIIEAQLKKQGINNNWAKYQAHDYFFDIWSNIHYGYVGRAVGFSFDELTQAAGIAQYLSDSKNRKKHLSNPSVLEALLKYENRNPNSSYFDKNEFLLKDYLGQTPETQYHKENGSFFSRFDSVADQISIKVGINLYSEYPPEKLTSEILLNKIESIPTPWGVDNDIAKRIHVCEK